ncbi:MAG: gluconate 2-dehydrogenase subunit 3 family protein [Rhizobiales bacterium]|nr:gluconate 2-dehydrogenase subunit 3 family protein [Hyphomicrobiales bacterium]
MSNDARNSVSRRKFLMAGAAASAVVAGAPTPAGAQAPEAGWQGYAFLTSPEVTTLNAIVDRLIPADQTGPGGVDAGVVTYIDRQLAGRFGAAAEWYMQGPWGTGTPSQGWQFALPPATFYRKGLLALDRWCRGAKDKDFADLSAEDQDDVLEALAASKVDLEGIPPAAFFEMIRENTAEGYLSDPLYGGNRNMAAWKMIGFPGATPVLTPAVSLKGEAYVTPPLAIGG